jgi:hypothetical protein
MALRTIPVRGPPDKPGKGERTWPGFSDFERNEMRILNDLELEQVSGGIYDDGGCIRFPTIEPVQPPAPWTFKDVFAKHTIGR